MLPLTADTGRLARVLRDQLDWGVAPVLADALEEAGCDDSILSLLRQEEPQKNHSVILRDVGDLATRAYTAELKSVHRLVMGEGLARLRAEAKRAYAEGHRSEGYWLKEEAKLLEKPGYIKVEYPSNMRGRPPDGVIWVRPASGGKWSKTRMDKFGQPLTIETMRELLCRR